MVADRAHRGGTAEELLVEVDVLRRKRGALILAHHYQEPEVQDLADVVGDSLRLALAARESKAQVILLCGVVFMAETAKILNPRATVLLPDMEAGCSMVRGCMGDDFREWLSEHKGAEVVSYVNSSTVVKALSDIVCTSSNAVRVVESVPAGKPIAFAPDRNLGRWVEMKTGREMAIFPGACEVHVDFRTETIEQLRLQRPSAKLLAHPECDMAVILMADFVGSTSAMLDFVARDAAKEFLVATEEGIIHGMSERRPDAEFVAVPLGLPGESTAAKCPGMRRNTLAKIAKTLRDMRPEIVIDEALRQSAHAPIERMLSLEG
jgi:quinolinate synthase